MVRLHAPAKYSKLLHMSNASSQSQARKGNAALDYFFPTLLLLGGPWWVAAGGAL